MTIPPDVHIRFGLVLVTGLLAAGCAVGPDYEAPVLETPETWNRDLPRQVNPGGEIPSRWWMAFNDPVLNDLIKRAELQNLDLQTAFARVNEALAVRGVARGDYYPSVAGVGAALRNRTSDAQGGALLPERESDFYSVGLDASWEVDLWGRIRRSVESADASLDASVEAYRDTLVVLNAEVTRNYFLVKEARMRIDVALRNIENQQETLRITTNRYDAGLVPALDTHQAQLNLSRTESTLPLLRKQQDAALNRLSVLLGVAPGQIDDWLDVISDAMPMVHDELMVGVPADLIRQRPDVRRAERLLAAQSARIGVAKADLYPRLSLSGSFAFEASDTGDLGSSGSEAWSFGPGIRWALFQGGRIRSNVEAEKARTQQALLQYRQTVLRAMEEAENAFSNLREENARYAALAQSVRSAEKSVQQVKTLYDNGLVDFQNVLDMERSLVEQQDALAQSAGERSRAVVSIFRALGGGWELEEE